MSFGLRVIYGGGEPDFEMSGRSLRFVTSVRAEYGESGSLQLPYDLNNTNAYWMFSGDDGTKVPHQVSISSSGLLEWSPYPYFPTSQGSGTILVTAFA